jgi:hypothetical protein
VLQTIPYFGVLAVESLAGVFGLRLYEEPRHTLLDRVGSLEIRRYVPRVAATVEYSTIGDGGRNDAFKMLFAYIAGSNSRSPKPTARIVMTSPVEVRDNERLAMTAPVQTSASRMLFFLPSGVDLATAPRPLDPRVNIVAIPAETVAVLRFSGLGDDSGQRQGLLISKLKRSKWRPVGDPFMLYYDAPLTLPFLRRNEAAVVVEANGR